MICMICSCLSGWDLYDLHDLHMFRRVELYDLDIMHNFSILAKKDLDDLDHDLSEVCKGYTKYILRSSNWSCICCSTHSQLTRYQVLSTIYSSAAVAAVNSSNIDNNAVLLYRCCCIPFSSSSYFYSLCLGYVRRACTAVLASLRLLDSHIHTQRTTCSRHGIPHTSTASRYPGMQAAYFTTLTSQLKSNTNSSAV